MNLDGQVRSASLSDSGDEKMCEKCLYLLDFEAEEGVLQYRDGLLQMLKEGRVGRLDNS